jgi:hypothetical protein
MPSKSGTRSDPFNRNCGGGLPRGQLPQPDAKITQPVTAETAPRVPGQQMSASSERALETPDMNKFLTAATLALVALSASGAEAGFSVRLSAPAGFSAIEKAGCGGGHYGRSYSRRVYRSASRPVKRKLDVASKPAPAATTVVKAEPETKAAPESVSSSNVAETENSSIAAKGDVAATASKSDQTKVLATKDVGCKKFFPAVGLTLSVSCE